jgi:acyl transferase domain-containing protein/NADPH:quinone reductase-like Zn-dependent oxidoreductase/acyl carrier protein
LEQNDTVRMQKQIAIVGYAFRLPGTDRTAFWGDLTAARDLVTQVPASRWAQEAYYHPRKNEPGCSYTFAAGTIGDVAGFDAAFFGISPREAEQMDPQQRLLLELTWEAFEHAGIKPSSVRGSRAAVYVGFSGSDYSYRRADDPASFDASTMTGNTASIAANRLSYWFDLRGPSMAVDTACSSTMVAFHQACQSLRAGESELAVTGGVSLHLHPFAFIGFSKASMLSPEGRCKVFDAAGDGYVRSEGAGIFLLKPLEAALADGNRVYAVVAGSGVNCDGRTNGLTVPSWERQAELLREVYADAGIAPDDIDYLEAHGTGTAVGDPIETRALGAALGEVRPAGRPLLIGSVKSNVGHLEAASAVAGLAKAMACLQQRAVPPTVHLRRLNPHIRQDAWNLRVVTETTPLDAAKQLVIGVNSFGFGGANAHVILQSADHLQADPARPEALPAAARMPLLLSGRGAAALRAAAQQYAALLQGATDDQYYDIAFSAYAHRELHEQRAVVFGLEREAAATALEGFAGGERPAGLFEGEALPSASRAVFVYSGNGAQWAGMGRTLLAESPAFGAVLEELDAVFARHGDFALLENLQRDDLDEALGATEVAQPLLFAVQVGVTELLRQLGLAPAAVVGHSVGEVAAAWACGALSLEQAVQVILERSAQQGRTRGAGGMLAVGLGEAAMRELLAALPESAELAIAGVNSPRGVTIAGPKPALEHLESLLNEREVFFRRLALDYAFHSAAMTPLQRPLEQALSGLRPEAGRLPFYSTVTGGRLGGERLDAHYWWRNIREPVQFAGAVDALVRDGFNVFVEVGPHAVLRNYVNEGLRHAEATGRVIPTLARDDDALQRVHEAFCQALIAGAPVELARLFPVRGRLVELPAYPWQREPYWQGATAEGYDLINRRKEHPLLGYRMRENATQWENHIDAALYPVLADHVVGDTVVFPAAGYAELALAAAAAWKPAASCELEELEIRAPLLLESDGSKTVRFSIDESDGRFRITSRDRASADPWLLNAEGRILGAAAVPAPSVPRQAPARPADVAAAAHYGLTERVGLGYGPGFRAVTAVWRCDSQVVARLRQPVDGRGFAASRLDPAALDGAFQLLVDLFAEEVHEHGGIAFVPVKIGRLLLHRPGVAPRLAEARLLRRSPRSVLCAFNLYDADGQLVAALEQVRFRGVQLRRPAADHTGYLRCQAVPQPNAAASPGPGLPTLESCAAACEAQLHGGARGAARRRYYDEVEPLLDALCASFVRQALVGLAPAGEPLLPEGLLAAGAVAPQHEPLLHRLLGMLREDGLLEPAEQGWRWSAEAELPDPADIWVSLLGDYPDFAAEVLLTGRAGMHLAEGLADPARAAELTPQGCGHATLAHYLGASPTLAEVSRAVGDLVRLAMDELPAGRRLRILELTSCRSQLSAHALPHVDPLRCDYLIGTQSPELVDELEPLQTRFPELEIRELDFLRQGASGLWDEERGFDLVLLANELADAEDPEQLLANLAALVAPGGQLVLVEQRPSRWADLVFGLQPRWWLRDAAGGHVSRLRPARSWQRLLQRHGFTETAVVQDLPDVVSGPYLLLARRAPAAAAAGATAAPAPSAGLWVLVQDATDYSAVLADALASDLRDLGRRVVTAVAAPAFSADGPEAYRLDTGAAADYEHLIRTVRMLHGEIDGFVFLPGVRLPGAVADSAELMAQATRRCGDFTALLQACGAAGIQPQVAVVTVQAGSALATPPGAAAVFPPAEAGDAADAALWGLARTAGNEYPDLRLRLVDLADPDAVNLMVAGLLGELLHPDDEDEVILGTVGRYVPRVQPLAAPPATASAVAPQDGVVRLDFSLPGPLKNLRWQRDRLAVPAPEQVEIAVRAAGLNFRDVMYAMGLLSDEALEQGFAGPTLGMELAGVVTRVGAGVQDIRPGDEVIAFAPSSFATLAQTPAVAVVPKPPEWSFEAAATVPTTFFTVYYALHHLARLQPGERVLIHGAAGGVGVAAIQFAKHLGAEIFATAGSEVKRDFVRLLGADHVLDSRSLAFADEILQLTDGAGVDVVLNSLAGEAINRNLKVLRPFGRFLELGKRDFYENTRIGLRPFRNNITYFGIDADQLMAERPALTQQLFRELMQLFAAGALKPLPYRAFAAADVVEAFRYMQQSRQIGKVVLSFRDGVPAARSYGEPEQRLALSPEASYLVTGGLSGFGLQTATWLAARGARHLVLLSRRGQAAAADQPALEALRRQGVQIHQMPCDVSDRAALGALLADIGQRLPPLRGIVHAAMVIDDGLLRGMTGEQLERVLTPKILGARHLHELTQDRDLDFFVLYSSATTVFGNPGQANYVAANSYLEALAQARRAQGLPALCVGWGPIGDVGYLARNAEVREALVSRMGGAALTAADALAVLERLLLTDSSGLAVLDLDWNALRRFLPRAQAPRYQVLARHAQESEGDADLLADLQRWVAELEPEELHRALVDLLKREVGEILRIAPEKLDEQRSLYDLGMDSLMGMELVAAVESRFGIMLPIMALSEGPTIAKLVERMVRQLKGGAAAEQPGAALGQRVEQAGAAHVADIAGELGEGQAERLAEEVAAAVADEGRGRAPSLLQRS